MLFLLASDAILRPALLGGGIALLLGVVILVVFHFFSVKKDPLEEELNEIMPGVNCGGCGYSGCAAYAEALASGAETNTSRCTAGGKDTADAIAAAMGVAPQAYIPTVAHVFCQGDCHHTQRRYDYTGTPHCASAAGLFAGPNSCTYGCLGFGDCYDVCEFNAIYIEDGIAKVNHNNCTACGKCVEACPKHLIQMIPKHELATKCSCSNHWPPAVTRKACTIGCIACRRCIKTCPVDAIEMDDNRVVIDQYKCIHCGKCVGVCPTKAITRGLLDGPKKEAADTAEKPDEDMKEGA